MTDRPSSSCSYNPLQLSFNYTFTPDVNHFLAQSIIIGRTGKNATILLSFLFCSCLSFAFFLNYLSLALSLLFYPSSICLTSITFSLSPRGVCRFFEELVILTTID